MSNFQIYENKTTHLLTNSVLTLKNQTNRNSHMYISNIMQQVEIPEHSQTKIVVDNCSTCCWGSTFYAFSLQCFGLLPIPRDASCKPAESANI